MQKVTYKRFHKYGLEGIKHIYSGKQPEEWLSWGFGDGDCIRKGNEGTLCSIS